MFGHLSFLGFLSQRGHIPGTIPPLDSSSEDDSEASPEPPSKKCKVSLQALLGSSHYRVLSSTLSSLDKEEGDFSESEGKTSVVQHRVHKLCPMDLCSSLMFKAYRILELAEIKESSEAPGNKSKTKTLFLQGPTKPYILPIPDSSPRPWMGNGRFWGMGG